METEKREELDMTELLVRSAGEADERRNNVHNFL